MGSFIVGSCAEDVDDLVFCIDGVDDSVFEGEAHRPTASKVSYKLLSVEWVHGYSIDQDLAEFFLELRGQSRDVFLRATGDLKSKRLVSHHQRLRLILP